MQGVEFETDVFYTAKNKVMSVNNLQDFIEDYAGLPQNLQK